MSSQYDYTLPKARKRPYCSADWAFLWVYVGRFFVTTGQCSWLAVTSASVAEACLFAHWLVGKLFRMLMPRRGVHPAEPARSFLSTNPDRSRQSLLSPSASCPKPCECCTPLAERGPKNRAPSPARFDGHPTFSHPIFDSNHEILSILPVGPRLTPRLQKPAPRGGPAGTRENGAPAEPAPLGCPHPVAEDSSRSSSGSKKSPVPKSNGEVGSLAFA